MSLSETTSAAPLAAAERALLPAVISPTPDELAVLSPLERTVFRLTHRMNQGRWKRLWNFCQRIFGATWIQIATYNIMRVHGLEHVEAVSHERPLLLAANHRSFFDLYAVSSVLFKRTRFPKTLFFPVRAEFFYDHPLGILVNLLMGWFSMYPPFFKANEKRAFDKYSMRRLTQLCQTGPHHIIGFHPEGKRNFNPDPYQLLPAQPGLGILVKQAQPQVVPVFVVGLTNSLPRQVRGNWFGGELIRIHFGPAMDLTSFYAMKDHVRTYKAIGEFVMSKIGELAEQDRRMYGTE